MPVVNVLGDDEDGYEVWLDTTVQERDGLCIGSAETKQAALQDAATTLMQAYIGVIFDAASDARK